MDKYYKFEKEIAESVGIEGAIILQWIKDNETATYIKLEKVFSGLPFWTETDLVSHLLDLHQKGLLNVDLDKKRISKESNAKSKVLQINNKTTSRANIDNTWQPSEDVVEILTRSGINEDFIKNADDNWYHCNDTIIQKIGNLDTLKTPKAYCFFYRKQKK